MNEPSAYTPWEKASASRRRFRRWFVDMPTVLYVAGAPHDCTIRDLTPASAGVQLESAEEIADGTEVALDLGGFGTNIMTFLLWEKDLILTSTVPLIVERSISKGQLLKKLPFLTKCKLII